MSHIGIDLRCLLTPHRTGIGEYTVELLSAVFALDHHNHYYLFYNSYQDVFLDLPQWEQANVHYVGTRWPNKLFNTIVATTRRPKLDKLIIDYSKKNNFQFPTTDARPLDYFFSPHLNFTALSPKTKHILTIHDISFEFFPKFFTPRQRLWHHLVSPKKQCERADIILTPSANTKRDLVDYYKINENKIKVVFPGLSSTFKSPLEGGEGDVGQSRTSPKPMRIGSPSSRRESADIRKKYNLPDNFILFLGTIEPRKNITGLIEAFEIFNIQYPISNTSLVIAGAPGWNNKKIYERAAKSKLRDKIKFLGFIKPEEKPALYAAASLFVYPSFYEGFGFPVLEAMASGAPVITSNRASLPEITGSAAYLANPNKPEEIAEGMRSLLNNQSLRSQTIKNSLEQAKQFNWNQTAQTFLNLLSS